MKVVNKEVDSSTNDETPLKTTGLYPTFPNYSKTQDPIGWLKNDNKVHGDSQRVTQALNLCYKFGEYFTEVSMQDVVRIERREPEILTDYKTFIRYGAQMSEDHSQKITRPRTTTDHPGLRWIANYTHLKMVLAAVKATDSLIVDVGSKWQ